MSELRDLQEVNGIIPKENGFHEYPKCYSFMDDECHESLLLENLRESNFDMLDQRDEILTYDHAHLVMEILGKFHALSLALKDKSPEKFGKLIDETPGSILREMKQYYDQCDVVIYAVLKEDEIDIRKKLEKIFGESLYGALWARLVEASKEPYSVFCHGDCKTNNFMFKYDKVSCDCSVNNGELILHFTARQTDRCSSY